VSSDTDLIREEIWESLSLSKGNREAFVSAHLSSNIGAQIFALRESRGWNQGQLAAEVGMAQPRISVLEGGYDNYSLRTLKRFASAFDVAVVVRFVSFSELVNWVTSLAPTQLAPVGFANDSPTVQLIGTSDTILTATGGVITNPVGNNLYEPGTTFVASCAYDYGAFTSVIGYPNQIAQTTWRTTNISGTMQDPYINTTFSRVPLASDPHTSGVTNIIGGNAGENLNSQLYGYVPIPTQTQIQNFVTSSLEMPHV
jgi:transcriptional regulator with XRE-family HTH domain